jgi:hypothetical protein
MMMEELSHVRSESRQLGDNELLLVSRRINRVMNSVGHGVPGASEARTPAYMHPADMAARGLSSGASVLVSHGFGGRLDETQKSTASVTRLIAMEEVDWISGLPRLGAIAVTVSPLIYAVNGLDTGPHTPIEQREALPGASF